MSIPSAEIVRGGSAWFLSPVGQVLHLAQAHYNGKFYETVCGRRVDIERTLDYETARSTGDLPEKGQCKRCLKYKP